MSTEENIPSDVKEEMLEALSEFASEEDARKAYELIEKVHSWYVDFTSTKYYENLTELQQEISEQILIDFTGLAFYRQTTEPDNWETSTLEEYCETVLPDEKYTEEIEYFEALSPVFSNFFAFLAENNIGKSSAKLSEKAVELKDKFISAYELANSYEDEEDDEEDSEDSTEELFQYFIEFTESEEFEQLSDEQKSLSEEIIMNFTDFSFHFANTPPRKWTPRSVLNVCLNILPQKFPCSDECFKALVPVLKVFIDYLGKQEFLNDSQPIINMLEKNQENILEKAFDKHNWDVQKAIMMKARAAGVDLTNEYEIKDFLEINAEEIAKEFGVKAIEEDEDDEEVTGTLVRTEPKIGRNDPCTCGSGKKYKKCCGRYD